MTAREKKWLKAKHEERKRKWFFMEIKNRMFQSVFECNMMGSKVFKNEKGNIEVKILTPGECFELKSKIDAGEAIPEDTVFRSHIL